MTVDLPPEIHDLLTANPNLLTIPEIEVLNLAATGASQRTIALKLELSRSAVRSRLENATRKLRNAAKEKAA